MRGPPARLTLCPAAPLFASTGDGQEDPTPPWGPPPADGGEARPVLTHPGGIGGVAVAADTGEVVVTASAMPGAADAEADAERRKQRKEAGVTAILHEA